MVKILCPKCKGEMRLTESADKDVLYACSCGYTRGIRKEVRTSESEKENINDSDGVSASA